MYDFFHKNNGYSALSTPRLAASKEKPRVMWPGETIKERALGQFPFYRWRCVACVAAPCLRIVFSIGCCLLVALQLSLSFVAN